MRPSSLYLDSVKRESVNARYNLAGSTPPPPKRCPKNLKIDWREQLSNPVYQNVIRKISHIAGCPVDNVVLTPGSSQAIFLAVAALTKKGDAVLIEHPTYEPFVAVAKFLGLNVRRFNRSGSFIDDIARIRKRARGVAAILISNPHAPTGHLYSSSQLKKIAEVGPPLIVDEVYRPHFVDRSMTALRHNNIVNIGGLSKSLGISNVRLGWLFCSSKFKNRIEQVSRLLHVDMAVPSLVVGEWALARWNHLIRDIERPLAINRHLVSAFVKRHPNVVMNDFVRGNLILMRIPKRFKTSRQFANHLLVNGGIWVRPGFYFGADRFVRINAMIEPVQFARAWKKIEACYG